MDASGLRKEFIRRRDAMPVAERIARSDEVWKRLAEVPVFRGARQALFFVTMGSEIETAAMRRASRGLGMTVAAPRCDPSRRAMRFHVLEDEASLVAGPYGILQPPAESPEAALGPGTVVLVPGSVFDRRGNRLGYGGGFYDRWLAGEGRGLPTLGLAFQGQVVERVPVGPLDIPVQWLVTDSEAIACGG
jgi:5-formyltetrahydrofolate cyclo-ligase